MPSVAAYDYSAEKDQHWREIDSSCAPGQVPVLSCFVLSTHQVVPQRCAGHLAFYFLTVCSVVVTMPGVNVSVFDSCGLFVKKHS